MAQSTPLADARDLLLREYSQGLYPQRLDYRTGEILTVPEYQAIPYHADRRTYAPTFDVRSTAALSRFLDHVDRRTLSLVNDCRRIYDLDKGNHHLWNRKVSFTSTQLGSLDRLVVRLDYANAIVASPASLASSLCLTHKNLYRYLQTLTPLIRVLGNRDGMAKGTIKILISPAYGFRYPKAELPQARAACLTAWYRPALLQ